MYFQKKNITVVFAFFISHKSVGIIKKLNNILQQVFKKMQEPKEKWKDTLFWSTL